MSADDEAAVHAHLGVPGHGTDVPIGSGGAGLEGEGTRALAAGRGVADHAGERAADGRHPGLAEAIRRLLVGSDPEANLALLQLSGGTRFTPVAIGTANGIRLDDRARPAAGPGS